MNRRLNNSFRVLMVMLVLLLSVACARTTGTNSDTQRPESGALFRHRWWNYYTRALDEADNRNFEAAVSDLTIAMAQRDRDQRMARTYGMHFIDYFPHREIGVVHYLRMDYETAEAELSRSIEHFPTAKARYYLDLARKSLIRQRGGAVEPPRLNLDLPSEPLWSRADKIQIRGRVTDPNYVSNLRVHGQSLYLDGGQKTVDIKHDLDLPQGCHTIWVEADNLAGQHTRRSVTVCADRLGPAVVVEHLDTRDTGIRITGVALDASGVAELRIAGHRLPAAGAPETAFSYLLPDSAGEIAIECRDGLGNETVFSLDRTRLLAAAANPRLVAGLQLAGLFKPRDDTPPSLHIPDWQAQQTVYLEKVVITGSVSDRDKVVSLTINNQPVLPRPGALLFFSHIVDLQPGDNAITIEAEDAAGNRSLNHLNIRRNIPKALLLEERLRLTVFAFEQKGRVSAAGFAFQDDFIHEIVQRRRFQVVERQRLDMILQEQNINRTRLIDTATAVQMGRLAAAQAIVAGSLVETRTGIEIIGRVIDSETGEILCTTDVYGETKTLPGLKFLARALVLKIHREFPLVDGMVIENKKDIIITDLTLDKIRAQRRILIYAENPVVHPGTRRPLGMDQQVLGMARITQADNHLSRARLHTDSDPAIQPRHHVITQ
ncbi:MAG: hypothetical protein HKM93_18755 [Desulfobacteraceae bacterium]|nr:hypothetical protein [Desulfobacteraceae bacterium]